jgi:fructoselysine-6-P-deglycase FrlB-like protein
LSAHLRVIEGKYLEDLLAQPQALRDTYEGLERPAQLMDLAGQLGGFQRIVLTGMGSSFHALHPLNLQLIDHGYMPEF